MAMTRPPERRVSLTRCAVDERHLEVLGVGRLARLERGHAGVQEHRRHADALGHQAGEHLGGERAAGAGHLGRPRLGGVHVLVGGDRVAGPARSRSGWAGRCGPGSCGAARASRSARPTGARRPRRGRGSTGPGGRRWPPAGQLDHVAGRGAEVGPAVPADLHGPQPGRQLRREMHLDGRAVGGRPVELGRQRARRVDDDQVALVQEARQLREVRVHRARRRTWWPRACAPSRASCRGTRAATAPRARAAARTRAGAARAGDGPPSRPIDEAVGGVRRGARSRAVMPPLRSRRARPPGSGRSGGRSR